MTITAAQRSALEAAMNGDIYAGWNPGRRRPINANTIAALGRMGLVELGKTSAGETCARITTAGVQVVQSNPLNAE